MLRFVKRVVVIVSVHSACLFLGAGSALNVCTVNIAADASDVTIYTYIRVIHICAHADDESAYLRTRRRAHASPLREEERRSSVLVLVALLDVGPFGFIRSLVVCGAPACENV